MTVFARYRLGDVSSCRCDSHTGGCISARRPGDLFCYSCAYNCFAPSPSEESGE